MVSWLAGLKVEEVLKVTSADAKTSRRDTYVGESPVPAIAPDGASLYI